MATNLQSSQQLNKNFENNTDFSPNHRYQSSLKNIHEPQLPNNIKIQNQKIQQVPSAQKQYVNFFHLYKYSNKTDKFLIFLGIIFSVGVGCGLPFFALVTGKMIDSFNLSGENMTRQTTEARNLYIYIGIATFFAAIFAVFLWKKIGQRISLKCRILYIKKFMKKKGKFFKYLNEQKFVQKNEQNFHKIKQAIGFKVGTFIFIAASLIAGGRNAISTGWLLSLIMVSTLPILGLSNLLYTYFFQLKTSKQLKCYSVSQSRVQKVLSNLQTIKILKGQKHELCIFQNLIYIIKDKIAKYSIYVGLSLSWFSFVQFSVYSLAFWFGSHCVSGTHPCPRNSDARYSSGQVLVIFFAFYVRIDSMQQILPTLRKIYEGMESASIIYKFIEQRDEDDKVNNQEGNDQIQLNKEKHKINQINSINFKEISTYTKDGSITKILQNVNIQLVNRESFLIGSTQQKNSIIQLFLSHKDQKYEGQILINDININLIDMRTLEQEIQYIGRSYGLFEGSILQNLIVLNHAKQTNEIKQRILRLINKMNIRLPVKDIEDLKQHRIKYLGSNLTKTDRKKLYLIRIILNQPKLILIQQLSKQLSQQQQYRLYKLLIAQLQDTKIIYLGDNQKIIKSINHKFSLRKDNGFYLNYNKDLQLNIQCNFIQSFLNNANQISSNQPLYIQQETQGQIRNNQLSAQIQYQQNIHHQVQCQLVEKFLQQITSFQSKFISWQSHIIQQNQADVIPSILSLYKNHYKLVIPAFAFTLLSGILYPIFTIFLANIIVDTFKFKNQPESTIFIRQNILKSVLSIVYIGIAAFFINFVQNLLYSTVAQNLIQQIRNKLYQKILFISLNTKKELQTEKPIRLTDIIKISSIQYVSLATQFFPIVFKSLVSYIVGLIVSFYFQWRCGLLGIVVFPLMMLSGYFLMNFFYDNQSKSRQCYFQKSSRILQMIHNHQYLKLSRWRKNIFNIYLKDLSICSNQNMKQSIILGIIFGMSQLFVFISFILMFYFGSLFFKDNSGSISLLNLFTSIFAVIWSGWTSGSNFFKSPNYYQCKKSASIIISILKQVDEKDPQIQQRQQINDQKKIYKIKITQIHKKQNKRDIIESQVNSVQLLIKNKNRVYLPYMNQNKNKNGIGSYLLRLKQCPYGNITINGKDISTYSKSWLRQQIGIINYNSVVFDGTIKQNIIYNSKDTTDQQLISICQTINFYDHINIEQEGNHNQSLYLQFVNDKKVDHFQLKILNYLNKNVEDTSILQRIKIGIIRTILKNFPILVIEHIQNHPLQSQIMNSLENYQGTVIFSKAKYPNYKQKIIHNSK